MSNWYTELARLAADAGPVLRRGYIDQVGQRSSAATLPEPSAEARPSSKQAAAAPRAPSPSAETVPAEAPAARAPLPPTIDLAGLDPAQSIDRINGLVKSCESCGLCRTRNKAVPGTGSIHPIAMVIGEAPGADEDKVGLPFVGAAGQFLDKWLEAIGLSRYSNIYIANTLKCRPPQNRDPAPEEIAACSVYLRAQIQALKPRAILSLGRFATAWLKGSPVSIAELHGQAFDFEGTPCLPTYHPSAVLRNAELKRPVWEDLKTFKELCGP